MKIEDMKRRKIELILKYGSSKREVYNRLSRNGYSLAPYNDSHITRDYLLLYSQKDIKTFSKNNYPNINFDVPVEKELLFAYYSFRDKKPWGFDILRLPSKNWLVNVCVMSFPNDEVSKAIIKFQNLLDASPEDYEQNKQIELINLAKNELAEIITLSKYFMVKKCCRLLSSAIKFRCKAITKKFRFLKTRSRIVKIKNN